MNNKSFTETDTADYYNTFSNVYELVWNEQIHTGYFKDENLQLSKAVSEMNQYIAELVGFQKDKRLLNIGCGRGGADRFLAKNFNLNVEGIDISERQIGIAKEKTLVENLSDKCHYTLASATSIPFSEKTFDYVLCQESFFHIHDKEKAVSEFKRVLKDGGLIVLEDTLRLDEFDVEEIGSFCGRVKIDELFTEKEYIDLFSKAGLELKKKADVSDHLATTYHKIVEFIENNRSVLEEKVPEIYKDRVKANFGFDVSEKLVLAKKLGCMIFIFQSSPAHSKIS